MKIENSKNLVADDEIQMAESKIVKLSLMAYFDDLCRYRNYLSSYDKSLHNDIGKLLKICEQLRMKWLTTMNELKKSQKQTNELMEKNVRLEMELNKMRKLINDKTDDYNKINKELLELRSKVKQFTQIVNNDNNDIDDNDMDEDFRLRLDRLRTIDNVDYNNNNININESDLKIEKYRAQLHTIIEAEEELENKNNENEDNKPSIVSSPNSSDLTIDISEEDDRDVVVDNGNNLDSGIKFTNGYKNDKFINIPYSHQQLAKIFTTKQHEHHSWKLNQQTSHRMIICSICNERIGFYSKYVSCDNNGCDANAHERCINNKHSNVIMNKKLYSKPTIMDFIQQSSESSSQAMVPKILINCCNEIEKRGIKLTNIYQHNNTKSNIVVQNLMLNLLYPKIGYNNNDVKISQIDIDTLCNIVLNFLDYLIDIDNTLIPEYLYNKNFKNNYNEIINNNNNGENLINFIIDNVIMALTDCNRHTLAYLLIHLRKIAKNRHHNNMSIEKLVKIFSTKIFHPSFPADVQEKILSKLLSISSDYWINILSSFKNDDNNIKSPCSYKSAISSIYNTPIGVNNNNNGDENFSTPPTGTTTTRKFQRYDFSRILVESLKF